MANWNKKIVVEVKLPYSTQGCTLGHLTAQVEVPADSIWISEDNTFRWKSEQRWGDHRLLVSGKSAIKGIDPKDFRTVCQPTTCKVEVHNTHDGLRNGNEQYRCRVVSYN